jgi:hypothetical protein
MPDRDALEYPGDASAPVRIARAVVATLACILGLGFLIAIAGAVLYLLYCGALWLPQ